MMYEQMTSKNDFLLKKKSSPKFIPIINNAPKTRRVKKSTRLL